MPGSLCQRSGNGNRITWAHDANYYQFWNDGAEDGTFTITNVRPGTYTLHAFADGVLGEFEKTNITVKAGKTLDLGKIEWKPVRYGKQVWEIGYPEPHRRQVLQGRRRTTGSGAGACAIRCCSPTTSPTPSARATTTRTGSSSRCRTATSTAWLNPAAKDPANQRFGWVKAGTARRGHVADDRPGPGDDLDHQVQHGQGGARQGDPARGAGRRRRYQPGRGRQRPDRRQHPARLDQRHAVQHRHGACGRNTPSPSMPRS